MQNRKRSLYSLSPLEPYNSNSINYSSINSCPTLAAHTCSNLSPIHSSVIILYSEPLGARDRLVKFSFPLIESCARQRLSNLGTAATDIRATTIIEKRANPRRAGHKFHRDNHQRVYVPHVCAELAIRICDDYNAPRSERSDGVSQLSRACIYVHGRIYTS